MSVGTLARLTALLAAGTGVAGIYYESTPMAAVAALVATGSVIGWARFTAPHDHWREFRRRDGRRGL
ncbi:MAG: hypothetical protein ACLQVI_07220 [Polyangiaceae bacterium]